MSKLFFSAKKLLQLIEENKIDHIHTAVLNYEMDLTGRLKEEIFTEMTKRYRIMKKAAMTVLDDPKSVKTQVAIPSAHLIKKAISQPNHGLLNSMTVLKANMYAIAVMECNASLGRIVAAPTAGSAGIIPGSMIALEEDLNLNEEQIVNAVLVASGIGLIIGANSTFSAAKGGCQVEVGASSCMAAAAISYLNGLSPEQCINASALSLQNMLGLACDPVGGLVEIPCIKRNGFGVSNAFLGSDMSKMGLISEIPLDEVIDAMNNVAQNMHSNIRETSKGGLAQTQTAIRMSLRSANK